MKIKTIATFFFLTCFILTLQITCMHYPPRAAHILPQARTYSVSTRIQNTYLVRSAHHSQSLATSNCPPKNYKENSHPKDYLSYLPDDSLVKNELKNRKRWLLPFWKSKHRKASDHIMETLEAHDKEQKIRFGNDGFSNIFAFISLALNSSMMENSIRTILINVSDEIVHKEKEYISSACYKIEEARRQQIEQVKKENSEKAKAKL